MKKRFLLVSSFLLLLMASCLKDNDQGTIVLMGTEADVKPIEAVIPDALLNFITDPAEMDSVGVLQLPEGHKPPDIQGEYMFCPIQLCADNGHGVPKNDTIYFRFGGDADTTILRAETAMQVMDTVYYYPNGQNNMMVPCDLYGDVIETGNVYRKKAQPEAYVMGNGNDFTVYFTIDYDCDFLGERYQIKRGYVITGTVSSRGIEHAVLACVNISVDGSSNQGASFPEKDWIYVYRVKASNKFGTAERRQWYNEF